jgi:glyoxylase-like metal-dependent hydrolase (beta-lactamase superfamily II)
VLVGEEKALVLDTGAATESAVDFLLYETVRSLVNEKARRDGKAERELIVIHSHSHSDHYAGDYQFKGKVNVSVVEPNSASVARFFAFRQSPSGVAIIELGGRKLTILPTPGHQEEAITVYDPQTRWLLTGDTFYPGYIYVKDWDEYKMSIDRLVSFSRTHEVRALLGSHIEMTNREREYYPVGTNYQPDEAPLALKPESLVALDLELKKLEVPEKIVLNALIVAPMNIFQKAISNITRWIIQGST